MTQPQPQSLVSNNVQQHLVDVLDAFCDIASVNAIDWNAVPQDVQLRFRRALHSAIACTEHLIVEH